jgi:hypothetical protein
LHYGIKAYKPVYYFSVFFAAGNFTEPCFNLPHFSGRCLNGQSLGKQIISNAIIVDSGLKARHFWPYR